MDKKSLIGLLLMGALLLGYSILTRPSKEEIERSRRVADSIQQVQLRKQIEAETARYAADTLPIVSPQEMEEIQRQRKSDELGQFAEAATGEEEFLILENQKIKLRISTKGGRPYSAELKDYQTHDGKPLILFDGDSTQFNLNFFSQNRSIATQDLFFKPQTDERVLNAESGEQRLVMRLDAVDGNYIDYIYTLQPDDLKVGFTIRFNGLDQLIGRNNPLIDLNWSVALRQQEKGYKFEDMYSTVYYKYFEDEVGKIKPRKGGEGSADLTTRVEWRARASPTRGSLPRRMRCGRSGSPAATGSGPWCRWSGSRPCNSRAAPAGSARRCTALRRRTRRPAPGPAAGAAAPAAPVPTSRSFRTWAARRPA
ncbi:MAG: YidC/Oxa1 family insertase periplasmic-domain containing protein, partial [Bacteroidales bacterium]